MSSHSVKIVDGGQLAIPAALLQELGIDTGDTVVVELADDGLRVRSLTAAVRAAQAIVRGFSTNGDGLADQLIAERRAEAERE